ncbi:hypothetical protein FM109_14760 [Vibrio casei]|nr:hypothetical protein FM109_14760 [Vibrio casei]
MKTLINAKNTPLDSVKKMADVETTAETINKHLMTQFL